MRSDFGYFEEQQLGRTYDAKLLRRIYPLVHHYRGWLIGSIFLVVFITLLELSLPYLIKVAIDDHIIPTNRMTPDETTSTGDPLQRAITVDLTEEDITAIVEKYPNLFSVSDRSASIDWSDLKQLEKNEVIRLRRSDVVGLGMITLVYLAIILVGFALNFGQKIIMEYTGHRIMHDLRMSLYTHIQTLSVEFFSRNPVGRLVTRVTNDVQNMHELFTSVIAFFFKDLFLLVGIAVVLLWLNWKLALATFAILPLIVYASVVFSIKARKVFRIQRIKIAEINTRFSETIAGMSVIQLFGHEPGNYRQFKQLNHDNYLAGMRQIRIMAVFMPVIEIIGILSIAIIIFYGGGRVITGSMSLGALVAFISYMKMFFRPIRDLAEKYNLLQNAMASAERIFLILDSQANLPIIQTASHVRPKGISTIQRIDFENVSFGYLAGETVLKNITFHVNAGEKLAIVGPTGSGKTTLINLLIRFYDPATGKISINHRDLKTIDPSEYRNKMALVTQDPFLFSESIRDNIFRQQRPMSDSEIRSTLEISNCHMLTDRLPHGPDTMLSEGGASISSGERQLISIARAFAQHPQVILFDEATSYIDSQTELQIQEAMEKLMQDRTAIIIAHRLSTVRNADHILVLNRGRIVERGSHMELMDRNGFYYRLYQMQSS